jgi:bacteriocin biosynthesis cyclodehydratase domain-containing protein
MKKQEQATTGLHLHIHTVGSFGEKTGALLRELWQDSLGTVCLENHEPSAADWPKADVFVLAAWRPVPHLCRLFEEISYASRTPFIPITMEPPHLQVGPVVAPGFGACYTCFEKRVLQHSVRRDAETALRHFYESHRNSGPKGFLVPFAEIAAARLIQILSMLQTDPVSVGGAVWRFDTMTRRVVRGETVGIHGCIRCGLGTDEERRSFSLLHSELERLFPVGGVSADADATFALAD